ncbi:[Pyruvate dehydrogenase (acetyl-transferring)] kinase isozyme 2 [Savitreella phatthalungensis]
MSYTDLLRKYAAAELPKVSLAELISRTKGSLKDAPRLYSGSKWHATYELPVRLAHRIDDLDKLPTKFEGCENVARIRAWYRKSFAELCGFAESHADKEMSPNDWLQLGGVLSKIDKRHKPVTETLAEGLHRRLAQDPGSQHDTKLQDDLQSFLEVFHLSRISMRTTSTHYLNLLTQLHRDQTQLDARLLPLGSNDDGQNFLGIVERRMSVRAILQKAAHDARSVCVDYYGIFDAPRVQIDIADDVRIPYIPGYLWHVAFEIFKNSLRAIVELHEEDNYPCVQVSIESESPEQLTLKVSDAGGGIPQDALDNVWRYMYTTAFSPYSPPDAQDAAYEAPSGDRAIMAGFGYGLPISRLYTQFCGGDLSLHNRTGEGVDCLIRLPRHNCDD